MDEHGRFNERWRDKEHRATGQDYAGVPKHFYRNFKSNLIRDAHHMAKELVGHNRSLSPGQPSRLGGSPDNCEHGHHSISCGCKPKKGKIDLKYKFRSFTGGVRSAKRSKNVTKTAYDLYKPYRPCRRTCCGSHNPLFHAQRMQ